MSKQTMWKCDRCKNTTWVSTDYMPETWSRIYIDDHSEFHVCSGCRDAFTQFITNMEVLPVLPRPASDNFGFNLEKNGE